MKTDLTKMVGVQFVRMPDVIKMTGVSRSTIYALEQRKEFPKRTQLSPRCVAWDKHDIEEWCRNRIARPAEPDNTINKVRSKRGNAQANA